MPRPSSTQRLAADPEDAMDEESGLMLGLVYSARARGNSRARVLAPGVLAFEAGVRAQKRTTMDSESWKRKATRRESVVDG
ncbi:hypothetical protein Zm00014a_039802 [Zea mays]|uniref:Uncharacterized protein n=1 Tax=Zea mays TaxID=4577 RepID=A0A3L6ERB1_MAIZE|nr:hypothetical protein Zm00014a_039802 [Zea mays]